MKFTRILGLVSVFLLFLLLGCSKNDSPTSSAGRVFSGITQRDEFGDTLLIDPNDWVMVGMANSVPGGNLVTLPVYRNLSQVTGETGRSNLSLGAFPNPFIPGAGHLLIQLVLPDPIQVNLYLVNGSGADSIVLANQFLPSGDYTFVWDGTNGSGVRVSDDIFRVYFTGGMAHCFGDVMTTLSNPADPPPNSWYVNYANSFYDSSAYYNWEWGVATNFGPSGVLGGVNRYSGSLQSWRAMNYLNRFLYLPVFINYDPRTASLFQYFHLLALKHFQFGAGWPVAGNYGSADSTRPEWQYSNYYHDDYLNAFPGSP
jgi:hypothetical protein